MDCEWPQAGSPELHNFLQTLQIGCLKLSSYSIAGSAYKHACPSELHSGTAAERFWRPVQAWVFSLLPSTSCLGSLAGRPTQGPDNEQKAALRKCIQPFSHSLIHSPKAIESHSGQPPLGLEIGAGWGGAVTGNYLMVSP